MAITRTRSGVSTVVRVNLLPPEIEAGRKTRRAYVAMGAAAAAAVVVVGFLYVNEAGKVTHAKSALADAKTEQVSLDAQVHSFDDVKAIYAQVATRQEQLRLAMAGEVRWSQYMNDLGLSMPPNVWLDSAKFDSQGVPAADGSLGTVAFSGQAFAHVDVAAWLESLAKEKGYYNPYFSKSEEQSADSAGKQLITFDSTVSLNQSSLSGRYTEPKASR